MRAHQVVAGPRLLVWLLLTLAALMLSSCGKSPVAVGAPQQELLSTSAIGLLACTALDGHSATAVIGPAGGVLAVGPHSLYVPAGALRESVTITAVAPSDSVNHVDFRPEGLTFARPALLTMSYANCVGADGTVAPTIAYTDQSLRILERLSSTTRPSDHLVVAVVSHFSGYAVAW